MKRTISLLLTLMLLLASVVGCTPETVTDAPADGTSGGDETTDGGDETSSGEGGYFEDTRIDIVAPDETKVPDMKITGDGYDIYQLTKSREYGYRYGCTYLYNDDGSVDAYFACVGANTGEWDWIAYRHSPDGGTSWEDEKIVLTPTQGSMDRFSNCDPGVVYFDGYYYLGYTSTLNNKGTCNNVFVARSENPDGPFEKWNGEGWGGYEPAPLLYYPENYVSWGIGEPSFVELNGTLYIYYTLIAPSGEYMMVATADATDENWPATLQYHGVAVEKSTDSLDVKYVEEWGKFIGIATGDRMGPNSWVAVYESNDGYKFELVDVVREDTYAYLHNAGFSSRPNGRIRITEDAERLCVIYAYGEGWGTWNTRIQPVSLVLSDGNDIEAEKAKACIPDPRNRADFIPAGDRYIAMARPAEDVYYATLDEGDITIVAYGYDAYFDRSVISRGNKDLVITSLDESVVKMNKTKAMLVGTGTAPMLMTYKDCRIPFFIVVTEEPLYVENSKKPVALKPTVDEYTVYIGERSAYRPQIRVDLYREDGSFDEYYCNAEDPKLSFAGYDESIVTVTDSGIVTALKEGETNVTVSYGELSCTVKITVTDDPGKGYLKIGDIEEFDYAELDLSKANGADALTGLNSTVLEYDAEQGALKATVTGEDAFFTVPYMQSFMPLYAEDYTSIEITYMVPKDVSSKATSLQLFLCAGDNANPDARYQTVTRLTRDGEYHTATVQLSRFSFWSGEIHQIRVDYFDQSTKGDVIYIKSIKLCK